MAQRYFEREEGPLEGEESVRQLILAAQKGDSASAGALAEMYWDRVYSYVYRLTRNSSDAEDIVQDTFLRAFKNLEKYKPEGRFRAWLLRIATNLYFDFKKSPQSQDFSTSELSSHPMIGSLRPDEIVDQKDLVSVVWQEIGNLSREQQAAVVLRAVEKMEYAQIAEILEVQESTARWHMYEGRRLLRRKLGARLAMEGIFNEQ